MWFTASGRVGVKPNSNAFSISCFTVFMFIWLIVQCRLIAAIFA